jgi:hypothetical protein
LGTGVIRRSDASTSTPTAAINASSRCPVLVRQPGTAGC